MLGFFAILIIVAIAYAHWREGVFTACMMCFNIVFAGIVTFNFWEPLADLLDTPFRRTILEGYEDFLVMLLLFCALLIVLRIVTNNLSSSQIEFQPLLQQFGGGCVGAISGYLVSGILVCMMQTLPWHENFMDFEPRQVEEPVLRRVLPPDRVWLALMHWWGAAAFSNREVDPAAESDFDRYLTFDREGMFELNYLRFRRYGDHRNALPYGRR